ncbi:MAG: pyruvate, phosphate dikinase [Bacillota bacterium]|nr:pyruvate, phosphate dikinase [Bacillota bacterium]
MTGDRFVFKFTEGDASMRALLGGKGAGLAEMTRIGLPVPPGFTIVSRACIAYHESGRELPPGLEEQVGSALAELEAAMGKQLGDAANPLLVSVRSGAAVSMPGMMDTILNLGLNDQAAEGLAQVTGDRRFALDCYRRLLQMFGEVVLKVSARTFEDLLTAARDRAGARHDHELGPAELGRVVDRFKSAIQRGAGVSFPQEPRQQLILAVRAVFESWQNERARVYRRLNSIPDDLGTAVNVQAMAFGNSGPTSGSGVLFTRHPATGERRILGEYLPNAQGEDVVAGIRTPYPVARLRDELPEVYGELERVSALLERHYREVQDIEFTVEHGRLFVLQTRSANLTAEASVRRAVDFVSEGLIDRSEAVRRVSAETVERLLHRRIDPRSRVEVLSRGLPASPGAATGSVVFDADRAEKMAAKGQRVLLVRPETTPDDIHGMVASEGVLTSRGGMTCHAAIVARHMGKPCVVGCDELRIDLGAAVFAVRGRSFAEGDVISIDGASGEVIEGEVRLIDPDLSPALLTVLDWADEIRRLGVRANADTPGDAARARSFGAQGIGLCRTEHMFMAQDRLPVVQEMIMAETVEERQAALVRLLPMQQGDFRGILEAMDGLPVTIRLLDPPLHEFLPNIEELEARMRRLRERVRRLARGSDLGRSRGKAEEALEELDRTRRMVRRARALQEVNPMLGLRGCRLGIVYPEIYEMQARAIFQAAAELIAAGRNPLPEVMIPLVGHVRELEITRQMVERVAVQVRGATGCDFPVVIGTMIEIPRAALTAGEIAGQAEFFSFGTNDLTQTTFGFSRDDAEGKFLHHYSQAKVLKDNPFAVLDRDGVGRLIEIGVSAGRRAKPHLKVGICGEHGGEPRSIAFCHEVGLDYVSCSPYRVPVARLAAAHAALAAGANAHRDG